MILLLAVVALAFGMSACQPVMPVATPAVDGAATEEPASEATAAPAEEATVEVGAEEAAVTALATQALADELQVDPATVEVVSVEAVEWPDSCLGINDPNMMCAQVITPGYRVVLSADGGQYEYHTNTDGSNMMLAPREGA